MKKSRFPRLTAWAVCLLLATSACHAESLREKIDAILAAPELEEAALSVRVVELPAGRVLYSYHADEPLPLASNAKIVTTAAALDLLGGDFELTTTLVAHGSVEKGALYGDLVVVGQGDPGISEHWNGSDVMEPLRRFARETRDAGLLRVEGDLVADDFYFDRQFHCPSWPSDQWIHWYEAPVAALAFNDNCVDAVIAPGPRAGGPADITLLPDVGYVTLRNRTKTSATRKRPSYGFYRKRFDNDVTAKGYYPLGAGPAKTNFTVHDPSLYLATALRKALADEGIEVTGKVRRMVRDEYGKFEGGKVLAVHRTTLAEAVRFCNLNSQNLYAEMILKTMGREVEGAGSF